MRVDVLLGERTRGRLVRHRHAKRQFLGLDSRWQTRSNICWLGSCVHESDCSMRQGAIRESQSHTRHAVLS